MGTLRTLFAITVVFAHSYGYIFVGGRNAVQLFYIISGFLISHVIIENKTYVNAKKFYISRILRLYPIYCFIAILTFFSFLIASFILEMELEFFSTYNGPLLSQIILIFSNIFLFLQDLIFFLIVENNQLLFSTNFELSDILLYKGLLVGQAWTLSIELTFYIIAPFILPKRKVLYSLFFFSLLLRVYLIYLGIGYQDPWTYRFFPTELALFLLGAFSHQIVLPFYRKKIKKSLLEKYSLISTYFLIMITVFFWLIPINLIIKTLVLFFLFIILMPLTFLFQEKNKWDKLIGSLSYPIYICHIYVIYLINLLMENFYINNAIILSLASVTFTIFLSIVLNILIQNPIDVLRNQLKKQK
jgi:peptidoglycan/LPS O-acetylase OafA/YrhL